MHDAPGELVAAPDAFGSALPIERLSAGPIHPHTLEAI